jgi:hypothetical protein
VNRRNSKILKLFDTFQRYDPTHCVGGYGQSPLFFIFVSAKMLVKIIKSKKGVTGKSHLLRITKLDLLLFIHDDFIKNAI